MSLYSVSGKIAQYLTEEVELDQRQTDSVRYGLEIILGALIKVVILFGSAYFLAVLPQVMVAVFCGSLLRLLSGGAHCTAYLRCLSCGLVVYLTAGKTALYLEKILNLDQLAVILIASFLIMTFSALLWAPAEVPYRVINSKELILFKALTVAFMAAWLTTFLYFASQIKLSYIMAGLLALLAQTFSFTPPGYLVIGKIDAYLIYLASKKGGELNNVEN